MKLTPEEKKFLIERIAANDPLPDDFQEKLFPTEQKEYELRYGGKMRREDVLADQDGSFAVPLQIERIFNGERQEYPDGWRNMIVFGDNLHFLKTCYSGNDELIKKRVKGHVKLIYIDPPFGTGEQYDGNRGQSGYQAKRKSADFVEFLRRRLIVAERLLAENGFVIVRQAFNFGHYTKIALDEIFGKENFINEVVIGRKRESAGSRNKLDVTNESLFIYSKSKDYKLESVRVQRPISEISWTSFLMGGNRNPRERVFFGKTLSPPEGQHFSLVQTKCDKLLEDNFLRLRCKNCAALYYEAPSIDNLNKRIKHKKHKFKFYDLTSDSVYYAAQIVNDCRACSSDDFTIEYLGSDEVNLNNNWLDLRSYATSTGYPTENSEELLYRIIRLTTEADDLVLDFFGGSGTTAAVAEKMGRRWIVCDIGKFSFYTMQKRLLTIENSKDLIHPSKKFAQAARTFVSINTGLYDIEKLNALTKEKYTDFVLNLFEVVPKKKIVRGIEFHGERKDGYSVFVWDFWQDANAKITEEYLERLHTIIGKQIGDRMYIIAPVNAVSFVGDFFEIDDVRYYFLKIPYQIINELHREPFARARQPRSKTRVNDLDNAVGFHFMHQPDVECRFESGSIYISKFMPLEREGNEAFENFDALAMLILDANYNGKDFSMTNFYFADDLKANKGGEIVISPKTIGEKILIAFVDLFGNEFKQEIQTK